MVQGEQSRFVRRIKGEKIRLCHINQGVKHPVKKIFCGSFSFKSIESLYPVKRTINADKYIEVTQHKVVREVERVFPNGGRIFQQTWLPVILQKK